jgi:hypothetical protein
MPPWQRTKPTLGPSEADARKVQHQFTNSRLADINQGNNQDLLRKIVQRELAKELSQKFSDSPQMRQRFDLFTRVLQNAQLTINFKAAGWFDRQAGFDDYKTMYDFGKAIKGNASNAVEPRIIADNIATMPKGMQGGAIDKAMNPGKMSLAPSHHRSADTKDNMFFSTNMQFNPRTKQIFAAVNYGRRPHGSSTKYGYSFFILNNSFKTNALYFAGDTFGCLTQGPGGSFIESPDSNVSARSQLSYDTIAAAILYAPQFVRKQIIDSCLFGKTLSDTSHADDLLEAHLFEPVKMAGGVVAAWVSGKDLSAAERQKDPTLWPRIKKNAEAFGRRTGVRVHFWDENG